MVLCIASSMLTRVCVAVVGFLLQTTLPSALRLLDAEQAQIQSPTRGNGQSESARVVLYHFLLTENTKHSADSYADALSTQCSALQHEKAVGRVADVEVFGSVGWIADSAPPCAPFVSAGGHPLSMDHLPLLKGHNLWSNCSCKYAKTPEPTANFVGMVDIWLNKLPLTCMAAEEHPDEITMFMDSNLYRHNDVWELAMNAFSKLLPGRLGMQNREDEELDRPHWFGLDQCQTPPRLRAKYIAVRGRDCRCLMKEYLDSMAEVVGNSTCGCFDEEMVFANLRQERLRGNPWGAPRGGLDLHLSLIPEP